MSDATNPPAVTVDIPAERAAVTNVVAGIEGSTFVAGELPAAFGELTLHNSSRRVGENPDTIATEAGQWSYILSLRPVLRAVPELLAVQIRLRILDGAIGVGILDRSGRLFLNVADGLVADGPTDVTFFVRGGQHLGRLVVRNAGNSSARLEWLGVKSFRLKDELFLLSESSRITELAPLPGWNRYYGGFAETPAEGIRQLIFDGLREPLVMPWHYDLRVTITPGEETSRALFVSGVYEPASMLALQRFLLPGTVLFDVGANVGAYTLVGSRRVGPMGHVYSFEPSSREHSILVKNLALNHCDNVTVIAAAASDRGGTGTLRIAAGQHRGQNTLASSFAYPGVQLEGIESVPLVSLDDLWRAQTLRAPDVIKIDAEGNELGVLRGAVSLLRESMPVIMFEVNDTLLHASGASRATVGEFLTGFGYTLHRVDDSTATLVAIPTLMGADSENFVALPAGAHRG